MSRTGLLKGMILIKSGINLGRLDRPASASAWGLTVPELSKAYNNWIQIFRYTDSRLTFHQYLLKMRAAGIGPLEVGLKNGQWQLARKGDSGAYTAKNCRFIPREANFAEQVQNGKHFPKGPVTLATTGHDF